MTPKQLAITIKNLDNPYYLTFNRETLNHFSERIKALHTIHNPKLVEQYLECLRVSLTGICYDQAPKMLNAIMEAANNKAPILVDYQNIKVSNQFSSKAINMSNHSNPGIAQRLLDY